MNEKKITIEEQICISRCINKYWGHSRVNIEDHDREIEYEECLSTCKICG